LLLLRGVHRLLRVVDRLFAFGLRVKLFIGTGSGVTGRELGRGRKITGRIVLVGGDGVLEKSVERWDQVLAGVGGAEGETEEENVIDTHCAAGEANADDGIGIFD
jgi:hypothetical protein